MVAATVPYTRASIYVGLPTQGHARRIDELLDNRLAPSSMRTVQSALAKWDVVCSRHHWPRIIASDDPARGGKLATFVLYMVDDTELSADSIVNYVWGLRAWTKLQRQLDPVYGLVEWDDVMQTVAVVAFAQSEPRRAIPIDLLKRALLAVNRASFKEVQLVILQLILLFTFARSESPLPRSFTGLDGFDAGKHLMVCDVEVRAASASLPAHVAVRLKGIKQDPRMERPEAAGNDDWILIGDLPGTIFSILDWMQLLFRLHGTARDSSAPFFVTPGDEARRPYRYRSALDDVRVLWARVSTVEEAERYGWHSLRVTGYDKARRGPEGEELAVVQGTWQSTAHRRYDRFQLADVLRLPQYIVVADDGVALPVEAPLVPAAAVPASAVTAASPQERPVVQNVELRRGRRGRSGTDKSTADAVPAAPLPLAIGKAAVGRKVLVPSSLWVAYPCNEHGGEGWEAVVVSCSRGSATVKFLHAKDGAGRMYPNETLSVSVLRPL